MNMYFFKITVKMDDQIQKIKYRRIELLREKHRKAMLLKDAEFLERTTMPRKPLTITEEQRLKLREECNIVGRAPQTDSIDNKIYVNSGIGKN